MTPRDREEERNPLKLRMAEPDGFGRIFPDSLMLEKLWYGSQPSCVHAT